MDFYERFNELVKDRGTVARLSEAVGISDSLLSKYRRGLSEPSFSNMILIADYFDVSLDWLACRPGYAMDAHKRTGALSNVETELLRGFRMSDETGREIILESTAAMAARFPSVETNNTSSMTA